MSEVKLVRFAESDEGTRGVMTLPGGKQFSTMELPWRDNRRSISCIPTGEYTCTWANSPKFGMCYHILNVPKRSEVLFHHGNYAGDAAKGLKTDSNGCILVGEKHGILGGQRAVLSSKVSRALFESLMGGKNFTLIVSSR